MNLRRATREDIEAFSELPSNPTTLAWVGELDGKIVGLAGLARVNGRWMAFCDLEDEARPFKMKIMRQAIRIFREAREKGIRFIYAEPNPDEPGAIKWMTSLGFERDPRAPQYYRWKA